MKEKINVRIAEVKIWGELADALESMEENARSEMEELSKAVNELYPDGGADVRVCWQYEDLQKVKSKLNAIEGIRATILKAMG